VHGLNKKLGLAARLACSEAARRIAESALAATLSDSEKSDFAADGPGIVADGVTPHHHAGMSR
jgi:hypothetical protein